MAFRKKLIPEPENCVVNPDTRICEVLAGLAAHHRKTWCYPTQEKILQLLKQFTGRVMARRSLNRHLAALERDGQIRRIRRHHATKQHGWTMRSTLYVIGGRFLARMRRINQAVTRFLALGPNAVLSGIRVPGAAQYARSLAKAFVPAPSYPQSRPPGRA